MQRAKKRRGIKHDINGKQIYSTFNTNVKYKHSVMIENKRIANCNTTSNCKIQTHIVKSILFSNK